MNWGDVPGLIGALGGVTTVAALYRWARAQGRADALAEQGRSALEAKNEELEEVKAENGKLWALLESLTGPKEKA